MQSDLLNHENHIAQGRLGRHETFTPRYGWLKKGYDAVTEDGNIFKASDAIERLGVGKNMVRSIRYWCQTFKLIEEDSNREMVPTELGNKLLHDDGWDPFLEDVASLWLLHWQLFVPPLDAVSWSFAFNKCNLWSFDIKQLGKVIYNAAQKYPSFLTRSEKTFYRDASCIIRMYYESTSKKESEIECPFTQLGLIQKAEEVSLVCYDTGTKRNLPALIFAASCFSYMIFYASSGQKTISLYRLTHDINSPGVVFKLPESAVGDYLYRAASELNGFSLAEVMGSQQLHFEREPLELYWAALDKYYTER
ncbi:MAG TPA: DUF4007 family protein [Syntrophomonadaceae bacterium]|nr:DUF4007 family protein [Syntrophomonadaceae bacterium]